MNKILIILFFTLGCFFKASAQDMTAQEYVQKYKGLAIEEMKRMGVPAAITLAQGLLETQNGNSDLFKESNNHFGIKCKSTWTAETVSHDDDAPGECFRKYKTDEDSYRDHSNFLRGSSRYAFLFQLGPSDYKAWAYGLQKAGYATNPRYPQILIKNIEDNNLEQYTDEALNDVPHFDASQYANDIEKDSSQTVLDPGSPLTQPMNLTINGSKALYVPKGTSLLAIATEHNINLEKLLAINDLQTDGLLQKDQYVFLEKKQKVGQPDFCIVLANETLYDISQKYGVVLQNLYDYNNLTANDFIVVGTKIFLKPQVPLQQVASSDIQPIRIKAKNQNQQAAPGNSITYIVQPKESLYAISKKYGVSVDNIKKWNNLKDNHLQIGQQLIISK